MGKNVKIKESDIINRVMELYDATSEEDIILGLILLFKSGCDTRKNIEAIRDSRRKYNRDKPVVYFWEPQYKYEEEQLIVKGRYHNLVRCTGHWSNAFHAIPKKTYNKHKHNFEP